MTHRELPGQAGEIYQAVIEVMQEAEEMGGPDEDDYVALMEAIATEATQRITAFRARIAAEAVDKELICIGCNGSGEGHYDGTRCSSCGGSGVECQAPDDDRDDFIEPDEPEECHHLYDGT